MVADLASMEVVVHTAAAKMPRTKSTGNLRTLIIHLFFSFKNSVKQHKNTTTYPHYAGLRWIAKDRTVWFIQISSETEKKQKNHQKTVIL